jgi:TonB family protein
MTFSELAAQQRAKELKTLRKFITCSLAGSVLLHSGFLLSRIQPFQPSEEIEPIEIVVTEPLPQPPRELSPEPSPHIQPPDPQSVPERVTVAARPNPPSPQTPFQPQPQAAPAPEVAPASPAEVPVQTIETNDPEAPSINEAMNSAPTFEGPVGFDGKTSGPTGDVDGAPGTPSGEGTGLSAAPGSGTAPGTGDTPQLGSRQIACRSCPEPDYPEEALRAGAEGSVRVNVDVDSNGRVVGVTLTGSSGNAAIDRAVIETVRRRYQFEGVGANGASIPLEVDMTVQGSERNRNARRRGDRRRITVTEDAPAPTVPRRTEEAAAGSDTPRSPDRAVETGGTGSNVPTPETPIPGISPTASPSPVSGDIEVTPSPSPATVETPRQPLRLEVPPPQADTPRREAQPAPPPVEAPPVNPAPAVQAAPQLPPEPPAPPPPAPAPPPPVAAPEPPPVAPAEPQS